MCPAEVSLRKTPSPDILLFIVCQLDAYNVMILSYAVILGCIIFSLWESFPLSMLWKHTVCEIYSWILLFLPVTNGYDVTWQGQ